MQEVNPILKEKDLLYKKTASYIVSPNSKTDTETYSPVSFASFCTALTLALK